MFAQNHTKSRLFIVLLAALLLLLAGLANAGEKDSKHGYLGIMLQDIDTTMAKAMDLDDQKGILVNEVVEDSPAEAAGLRDGDVILTFNGKNLDSSKDLTKVVRKTQPGEEVEIVVLRDGKKKTLDVELGEHSQKKFEFLKKKFEFMSNNQTCGSKGRTCAPGGNMMFGHGTGNSFVWHDGDGENIELLINGFDEDRGFMGIELDDINEQMGAYFDVEDGEGALVTSVNEDSAAEKAGLKAGDVIIKMGDSDIESAGDVHQALSGTKAEDEMEIKVVRKGKKKSFDITLGEMPESQMLTHLEMIGEGGNFHIQSPKMLLHGMSNQDHNFPADIQREIRILSDNDGELKEMREEMESLKEELLEIRKTLKKN